jgi:uncharacterized SAM-binding protein YcdF (DUF218 family)
MLSKIGVWLAQEPTIHSADAIVVLGNNRDRLHYGIHLYHQGLAPALWHTGAPPEPIPKTSFAQFALQRATKEGVPETAIHLLQTDSTWQDGQEIAAYARQVQAQRLLIVTEWYHSRRALSVIHRHVRKTGIEVYYAPATETAYSPTDWWKTGAGRKAVGGELLKIGYYGLRYRVFPWYSP